MLEDQDPMKCCIYIIMTFSLRWMGNVEVGMRGRRAGARQLRIAATGVGAQSRASPQPIQRQISYVIPATSIRGTINIQSAISCPQIHRCNTSAYLTVTFNIICFRVYQTSLLLECIVSQSSIKSSQILSQHPMSLPNNTQKTKSYPNTISSPNNP